MKKTVERSDNCAGILAAVTSLEGVPLPKSVIVTEQLSLLNEAGQGARIPIGSVTGGREDLPQDAEGGTLEACAPLPEISVAFVVESVFADVETAIDNRLTMRFGTPGRRFTPLLSWQLRPRLGTQADTLSPVHAISGVRQPVLVIYGSEDRHARPGEAKALYAAAAGPKEIWEVDGAAHVDLYRYNRTGYENRVGDFLAKYLNAGQATAQPESKPK